MNVKGRKIRSSEYAVTPTLIKNIKKEMDRLDWNMSNLSRKTGITYSVIFALLKGKTNAVNKKNMKKIADALGVSEEKLLKQRRDENVGE